MTSSYRITTTEHLIGGALDGLTVESSFTTPTPAPYLPRLAEMLSSGEHCARYPSGHFVLLGFRIEPENDEPTEAEGE